MKVSVKKTYVISDDERLAIAHALKLEGKASHDDIRGYIEQNGGDFAAITKTYFLSMADQFLERAK
jgi:hypothetical protein